jgi:transcriptional regulator with XRE-family HTH domain
MATRRVELGPTGETVRQNIARVRSERRLTLRELAERLKETGRPLAHNTLSEIERGARRVDVDDLMAIAVALDASPNTLLLPDGHGDDQVEITGAATTSVKNISFFLDGIRSLSGSGYEFALRCMPPFTTLRRTPVRVRSGEPAPVRWIARKIESNGEDVQWSVSESLESTLDKEDEDD